MRTIDFEYDEMSRRIIGDLNNFVIQRNKLLRYYPELAKEYDALGMLEPF